MRQVDFVTRAVRLQSVYYCACHVCDSNYRTLWPGSCQLSVYSYWFTHPGGVFAV